MKELISGFRVKSGDRKCLVLLVSVGASERRPRTTDGEPDVQLAAVKQVRALFLLFIRFVRFVCLLLRASETRMCLWRIKQGG